eukprot:TRINITY_DN6509_c0_g1_i1.p1 TRINITY_DN6509_c0_g1~~TRINITY_DN6509_c0_g1_i1.p1  ORF type:complete len:1647 (+),score=409.51 TRINITY_DN6509_c0_g1_i1:106-4941(+)
MGPRALPGLGALLLLGAARPPWAVEARNARVTLAATWQDTSALAEAAEFAAALSDGGAAFWGYVGAVSEGGGLNESSAATAHAAAVRAADPLLPPPLRIALRLSLATREFSPRLEARRAALPPGSPPVWAELLGGGDLYTDPAAVVRRVQERCSAAAWAPAAAAAAAGGAVAHPGGAFLRGDSCGFVLHAALGDSRFAAFHAALHAAAVNGDVKYLLRVLPPDHAAAGCTDAPKVTLQGYGVTLAIKNMEYKAVDDKDRQAERARQGGPAEASDQSTVMGIDFATVRSRRPDLAEKLAILEEDLQKEEGKGGAAAADVDMEVWQMQQLGYQAALTVLRSADPLSAMADIAGNFPRRAAQLSHVSGPALQRVTKAIQMMVAHDKRAAVKIPSAEGESALWLNGIPVKIDDLTPFSLSEMIRAEWDLRERVSAAAARHASTSALSAVQLDRLLHVGRGAAPPPPRIRMDLSRVLFLNNLQTDSMYQRWTTDPFELLKPGFWSGRSRFPRSHLFTTVWVVDPAARLGLSFVQHTMSLWRQQHGSRFGVLMADPGVARAAAAAAAEAEAAGQAVDSADVSALPDPPEMAVKVYCAFLLAGAESESEQLRTRAWEFLEQLQKIAQRAVRNPTEADINAAWEQKGSGDWGGADLADRRCVDGLKLASAIAGRAGVFFPPMSMLANGVLAHGWPGANQLFGVAFDPEADRIRMKAALRQVPPDMDAAAAHDWVMVDASPHYHPLVHEAAEFEPNLAASSVADVLTGQVVWAGPDPDRAQITLLAVIDPATRSGRADAARLFGFAAAFAEENATAAALCRVGVLIRPSSGGIAGALAAAVSAAARLPPRDRAAVLRRLVSAADSAAAEADGGASALLERVMLDEPQLGASAASHLESGGNMLREHARVLELLPSSGGAGATVLYCNGRVLRLPVSGAVDSDGPPPLTAADFRELVVQELRAGTADGIANVLDFGTAAGGTAEAIHGLAALLGAARASGTRELPPSHADVCQQPCRTGFTAHGTSTGSPGGVGALSIVAVLNPLSPAAQRVGPLLEALRGAVPSCRISVWLNPQGDLTEPPLKAFHRYVVSLVSRFDDEGSITVPAAVFTRLPGKQVLTMGVEEPEGWITAANYAPYDLDNIVLSDMAEGQRTLHAEYELTAITVTGSCEDTAKGSPPRGLPLELRRAATGGAGGDMRDTLVMSNYGYFQLQAAPGAWELRISTAVPRAGQIYTLTDAQDRPTAIFSATPKDMLPITVESFSGKHIYVKVTRKPGFEWAELLEGRQQGISKQATEHEGAGTCGSNGSTCGTDAIGHTLNIFSVASGHLYERFLKIMAHTVMLAVPKESSRVKFWFIRNFLSPHFRQTISHFAASEGFDYELITYKWPHWLRRQTVKQRIIWGYKVLFLDVLFPLSVGRVIYVDADQIVRADLHELYNLDLGGHALAYTPFCRLPHTINNATTGFRFWDSGFWKSFLNGRTYHISAIYLVDLKTFRRIGAGDQYRIVYDHLSEDSGSLANLDQDLPNYLQNDIAIYSLGEEWLWCETWCSEEAKSVAKTIDLCNNPLTKTPKLEAAKRIVPEWQEYDDAVARSDEEALRRIDNAAVLARGAKAPAPRGTPT